MKKLNKFVAVLVALAMMAALAVTSAFALEKSQEPSPEDAYLVKYLKIPEGVDIPDQDFVFTFTAVKDKDDATKNSDTVKYADVPAIYNVTINAQQMHASDSKADNGALVYAFSLKDLKGVNADDDSATDLVFPHAGEYIYTVKENNVNTQNDHFNENTQEYTMHLYVINKDGKTVVDKVTVEGDDDADDNPATDPVKTKKDVDVEDPSVDDKGTDTKDDDEDLTEDDIRETKVQGFTFVNTYTQKQEEIPEVDPKEGKYGAFHAQKNITGNYGEKSQAFPITITVVFPKDYNGDVALNLYDKDSKEIKDTDGKAVELTKGTKTEGEGEEAVTYRTGTATVYLKDGEVAYFKNLPDGSKITVNEKLTDVTNITNVEHYQQTAVSTIGTDTKETVNTAYDKDGEAVTTKDGKATDVKTDITGAEVTYSKDNAQKINSTEITNESKYTPETTGIIVSNLPYIVLALVAVGGLVAYVVVRRKADDEA